MARILSIPDTHLPFQHQDYLKFLQFVQKEWDTDTIIHSGDLVDFHSYSRWPKSTKAKSGFDELAMIKKEIAKFAKVFPKMTITMGNHDSRIFSLAKSVGIDSMFLRSLQEILDLPDGWKFVTHIVKDNVLYMHGQGSGRAITEKLVLEKGMSVVHGHLHSNGGIYYVNSGGRQMFGMNVGSLINGDEYAFEYGKDSLRQSILGAGIIIDGVPYYEQMILNKQGRWRGY